MVHLSDQDDLGEPFRRKERVPLEPVRARLDGGQLLLQVTSQTPSSRRENQELFTGEVTHHRQHRAIQRPRVDEWTELR